MAGALALAGAGTPASAQTASTKVGWGDRVRIEARVRPDGSFVIKRLSTERFQAASRIRGVLSEVDPVAGTLRVLGFKITTSSMADFETGKGTRSSISDLAAGDVVEVSGFWSRDAFHATHIRRTGRSSRPDAVSEFLADVQSVDKDGLVALGRRFWEPSTAATLDEAIAERSGQPIVGGLARDGDEQQLAARGLGNWLIVGGRMDAGMTREVNFDLSDDAAREDRARSAGQLQAAARITRHLEAFTRIKLQYRLDDESREETEISQAASLRVSESYVSYSRGTRAFFSARAGRQRFRDTRGWFYDESLDALRLQAGIGGVSFDVAVADGVFDPEGPERPRRAQKHHIASVTMNLGARLTASGFYLHRDDVSARDERPTYYGVSVHARRLGPARAWTDVALRRGDARQTALRSWSADAGVRVDLSVAGRPSLSASYAIGSGDRVSRDDVDTMFRPTGLQSTSYAVTGTRWVRYYGEVFDPDLSNLRVITAAASVRPWTALSLEAIYHRYQQVELRRSLPSSALDADGTGSSLELGHEIDGVVALRRRPFDLALVIGIFRPGQAFAEGSRPAMLIKPLVRVYF